MITKVSVREFVRNSNILKEYDFVEVEDKKSKKIRGIFISAELAKEFREFLELKNEKEIQKKLDALNRLKDIGDGLLKDLTIQDIKANLDV